VRSVRAEFLLSAAVLTVPVGIFLSFPFGAFGFRASEGVCPSARAAFVSLSPEAERQALLSVRTSWRETAGGARRLRAELLCAELPEDGRISVLTVRDRSRLPPPLPPIGRVRTGFLPSQKAPPPAPIAAKAASDPLPFPREELLRMN